MKLTDALGHNIKDNGSRMISRRIEERGFSFDSIPVQIQKTIRIYEIDLKNLATLKAQSLFLLRFVHIGESRFESVKEVTRYIDGIAEKSADDIVLMLARGQIPSPYPARWSDQAKSFPNLEKFLTPATH